MKHRRKMVKWLLTKVYQKVKRNNAHRRWISSRPAIKKQLFSEKMNQICMEVTNRIFQDLKSNDCDSKKSKWIK